MDFFWLILILENNNNWDGFFDGFSVSGYVNRFIVCFFLVFIIIK